MILLYRQACRPAPLYREETCRPSRPLRLQTSSWKSRLLGQTPIVTSSRSLHRFLFKIRVFCLGGAINPASSTRNRALRFCHVFLCYLPQFLFKCLFSITLMSNYNRTNVKVAKRAINRKEFHLRLRLDLRSYNK